MELGARADWGNGGIYSPQLNCYWLPGPDEGGMGPRKWPFSFVTGWSSLGHLTVNSPFIRHTILDQHLARRGLTVKPSRPLVSSVSLNRLEGPPLTEMAGWSLMLQTCSASAASHPGLEDTVRTRCTGQCWILVGGAQNIPSPPLR